MVIEEGAETDSLLETRPDSAEEARRRLRAALEEHGFAVTAQRRVIYQELAAATDHPTAETLHERLRNELPEVSLATVYKSLHLFLRLGLARAVATPDGKARFDVPLMPHHHLRCVGCGTIVDVVEPRLNVNVPQDLAMQTGFQLIDSEVQLSGLCPTCQQRPPERLADRPGLRRRSGPRRHTH
jgi:Fur family peroxide stress response transcriptional regulator